MESTYDHMAGSNTIVVIVHFVRIVIYYIPEHIYCVCVQNSHCKYFSLSSLSILTPPTTSCTPAAVRRTHYEYVLYCNC